MDTVTRNVADYVKKKRINLAAMSRDTGISYAAYTILTTMQPELMRKLMQRHSMMEILKDIPHMYSWMIRKLTRHYHLIAEHGM
jgi:hypothetical protein